MRAAVITLGCKVNFYDSEKIKELFLDNNFKLVDSNDYAEIYLINTCSVTHVSDKKSRKIISRSRKNNLKSKIIAMGCYAKLNKNYLLENKIVDYVCDDINNLKKILLDIKEKNIKEKDIKERDIKEKNIKENDKDYFAKKIFCSCESKNDINKRIRAFIKIQDGCDDFCSYCIIPYARGPSRCRSIDEIICESKYLCDKNKISEIVLTGINISKYKNFLILLEELNKIDNLKRLRISSIEVNLIDNLFIDKIKSLKKICPHFHIPLQSGSDKILKLMNRKYDSNFFYESIKKIKNINKISITSDVIVGFPGENENDFNNTYELIKKIEFTKVHVFPYSIRKNTRAANFKDHVKYDIKKQRVLKLIDLNKELFKNFINNILYKEFYVLLEEKRDDCYYGYTENYIKVIINSDCLNIKINDLIKIKIIDLNLINNCPIAQVI